MKKQFKLLQGDNMISLKKLPDNSIDSIVSDPPYGLSFMGKKWDYDVPSVEFWKEVYRVLKPGGHILSFGGTRTYHRMAVNIEDAGFEIRDQIMWIYGSGFPKSHNIGKAVDKLQGNERVKVGERVVGDITGGNYMSAKPDVMFDITKGTTPQEGWGTALKPANEPICVARKPLSEKTIADNVLKWGTGGINVDGCRIGTDTISTHNAPKGTFAGGELERGSDTDSYTEHEGRFPANIIFDESAAEMLDEQSGVSGSKSDIRKTTRERKYEVGGESMMANKEPVEGIDNYGDKGGASRFFYIAKVSKSERNMGLDGFEFIIHTGTVKHLIYKEKNKIIWDKQDQRTNSHQADMVASHQKGIEEFIVELKEEQRWNTELFGNYIMDQCQKDFKSITLTEINSTTTFQTLNSLIQKNIKTFIADAQLEKMVDIKYVSNAELKNTRVSITLLNKDGYSQSVSDVEYKEALSLELSTGEIKSIHPTMKGVQLMAYLVRLVTPPNGIVLDPFMGSGSTGISTLLEGFRFCGMEMDEDYFKIAQARIENYELYRPFVEKKKKKK